VISFPGVGPVAIRIGFFGADSNIKKQKSKSKMQNDKVKIKIGRGLFL